MIARAARNGRSARNIRKSSSDREVRYAVIGQGYISQVAVLPAFAHARRNSVLAALVSDDRRKLRVLGRRYEVPLLFSYDEVDALFESGAVDAVYIALPNSMHVDYAVRAARAGLHVLCEKPMAVTAEDCRTMMAAAEKSNVRLMIAYRLHFDKANLEVSSIVRSGQLGKVRYFDSQFSMQVKKDNIRTKERLGGGPLYDIGIYCINAVRMNFAAEPTRVWATSSTSSDPRFREVEETVVGVLEFPDDRVATFICSFGAADRGAFEVIGRKGSIRLDPAYEHAEGLSYELAVGDKKRRKHFAKSDQFGPELIYFSDCILKGTEPEPSGREGLVDVEIIEALLRSIESGRWETLHFSRRRRPSRAQIIRRPPLRKPELVHAESPHS